MKTGRAVLFAFAISVMSLAAAPAMADDVVGNYQIASVIARPDFTSQLEGVSFYFGDTPHPAVARRIEANVTTSLRTRKLGRSNEEACQWVMLSALMQLRDRARPSEATPSSTSARTGKISRRRTAPSIAAPPGF